MTDQDGIAHLDFSPACDLRGCPVTAVWAMTFHPCPVCDTDNGWLFFCRAHGFQIMRHRSARCPCSDSPIPLHTWKAIDD